MPSAEEVPIFVKDRFSDFYRSVFERAYQHEEKRAVFTEYAWNGGFCDPCADPPLTPDELKGLGVFWAGDGQLSRRWPNYSSGAPIVTRLHVRYDREHFPEDLVFQETGNQQNFQARYVLRHAFRGELTCPAGQDYLRALDERHRREASTLADMTGWELTDIYGKMGDDAPGKGPQPDDPWYKRIWK
jgi:hypothetical protein